jgi:hypothetical protein
MEIKTFWTFDPSYPETTREKLERALEGEIARWVRQHYPVLVDRLERAPKSNSTEQHEGAPTDCVALGQLVWVCACLSVNRTLPAGCWVCLGPHDFVKNQYDQYAATWEEWNLSNNHAALKAEFETLP